MNNRFNIKKEKVSNSILFTLEKLGGRSDFHKIFKILYFADQKHLTSYGFPITGDFYIAMKNGPVPSQTYDLLKSMKGDSIFGNIDPRYEELFDVQGYYVAAKKKADMEELAQSDIECLLEAIDENRHLDFGQLTNKSHKQAWEKANNDSEMSVIDIAEEADVDEEMKKYILLNLENQQLFSAHAKSW
jgi:uncharacterized phage-associated protein